MSAVVAEQKQADLVMKDELSVEEEDEMEELQEEEEQQIFEDGTEYTGPGEQKPDKPTKDEINVAKWMKKNVKTKKTKFLSHNVEYFTSNKAIDALMKSKFAEGDASFFPTREHAVEFLDSMLEHKFFHRAKKVPVTMEELRGKNKEDKSKAETKEKGTNKKTEKADKEDDRKDTEAEGDQSAANGEDAAGSASCGGGAGAGDKNGSGDKKEQKRKRKIRLDMHPEQLFVDGSEAYVWIYDPIPIHYWIYGCILLLGAIGICLFPLWPQMLRKGVYYLSVAAAGFLVFILALTVVRLVIFTIVWAVTGGKLHFWIFPNLTEDVGFFASFWPLYESKYVSDGEKSDKKSKSKSQKKLKDKDSDVDEDADADGDGAVDSTPLEPEKIEEIKEHDADSLLTQRRTRQKASAAAGETSAKAVSAEESNSSEEAAAESDAKGSRTGSESESEISGKDYEIISSSEVQHVK